MNLYKRTLNLPNTQFPMRGNLSQKEPLILKKWNEDNIYHIIQNNNNKKKNFLLHDGPPYANGNIHIGHAINKILKDIIIKSKTLSGFKVPYIPLWDCHGLPIEHQIEKKIGSLKNQITQEEFRKICLNYVNQQVKKQKIDFIRLGVFGDWKNYKLTVHKDLESNVIRTLGKIIENKYLYRGLKPVHWCIKCQSALAEAEVEYYNKNTKSIFVMFKVLQDDSYYEVFSTLNIQSNIHIVIWTTTPWSLPANRAIAINKKFEYQLIQFNNNYIIIAKELVNHLMRQLLIKKWIVIKNFLGKQLKKLKFIHPFLKITIPIILSDHVKLTDGTGAVHIAPDYGEDDYLISKKYNIQLTNIIDHYGNYIDNIHTKIDKKNIFKSNDIIIDIIKKNKLLLHETLLNHSYPHCWRHKYPIIYKTTPQWFIDVVNNDLKKNILNKIKSVKWIPGWGYNRMRNMIINRPDWCISRQRTWGIPITIFIHKKTGQLHPNTTNIINKIADIVEKKGSDVWWKINQKTMLGKNYQEYEKSNDILDVWFESGCINNLSIYPNQYHPKTINMYLEGSDQYRGWFMSSLIISNAVNTTTPYQEVISHGFVIDKTGQKMSKSIGNVINPNEIIKLFGADILRLWVSSTNYNNDIIISQHTFHQISDYYRRIRNTIRFLLSNIYDFNPQKEKIQFNNMIIIDQWIMYKTYDLQDKIIKLYNNYKFYKIIKYIIKFCSIELGSFYLDIIKDRQYTNPKNSISRKSGQTAMYYIINHLIRWITPILPFTSDEAWNYIPGKKNKYIFTEKWFVKLNNLPNRSYINYEIWSKLFNLKNEINKIFEEQKKKSEIVNLLETKIVIYAKQDLYQKIKILENELKFIFLSSYTKIKKYEQAPKNTYKSNTFKEMKVLIKNYLGEKCPRCWNFFNKVKITNRDKKICNRCNINLYHKGEKRQFA